MAYKKRKSKITITDSINQKLDEIEMPDSSKVYAPKKEKINDFVSLVGEEVFFEEPLAKKNKEKKLSGIGDKVMNTFILIIVLVGFIGFLTFILKLNS